MFYRLPGAPCLPFQVKPSVFSSFPVPVQVPFALEPVRPGSVRLLGIGKVRRSNPEMEQKVLYPVGVDG